MLSENMIATERGKWIKYFHMHNQQSSLKARRDVEVQHLYDC